MELEELFEMLLEMLYGMYQEIIKKTGVRLGFSAVLPGLLAIVAGYLLIGEIVSEVAGSLLSEGLIDILSAIVTLSAVILTVKWYINRLRYTFGDGLVCKSKINLLKFDIAVSVVELIYFVAVLEISSLCVPYDDWCVMIATPVVLYVLHKLFTAWLDRFFISSK